MSLAVSSRRSSISSKATRSGSGFRKDIQGLRAVAVAIVLLYHARAPFMSGGFVGVDVFFVISGFLITGLLLKEAESNGTVSLTGFYARRAKRILPAATLVLVASALMTYTLLPRTRWDDTAWQILGAAFNVVNWILAGSAVDYLAGDDAASPVQHFWTLAVEEQFYIVWPLLIAAALFFSRAHGTFIGAGNRINFERRKQLIRVALLILTVPSLAWSVYYTAAEPGSAYFVTTTRSWELGIGAIVAVFATSLHRISNHIAAILSWSGLAAIAVSATLYTSETPFPGYAALLPTLGAAAVIVGGMGGRSASGAGSLLSLRPFTWVGDISYSLYLWHWPLIVVATYFWEGLTFAQGLVVVVLSAVPAYLSYRYVEKPILQSDQMKASDGLSLQMGTVLILVASLAAMAILLIPKPVSTAGFVPQEPLSVAGDAQVRPALGAELLASDPSLGEVVDRVGNFQPSPLEAATDNPVVYEDGCHQSAPETEVQACVFGDRESDFEIAIVGDSHAAQWVPALTRIAEKNEWRMTSYTKSACPLTTAMMPGDKGSDYVECSQWNTAVLDTLTGASRPDFVLLTSSSYNSTSPEVSHVEGLVGAWSALKEAKVPFAVLADTPHPKIDVPECVSANPEDLSECAVPREEAEKNGLPAQLEASNALGDVAVLNLNRFICPETQCPAVIGNVLVYRDTNHLTATYASTLATSLEDELRAFAIPFAPDPEPSPSAKD